MIFVIDVGETQTMDVPPELLLNICVLALSNENFSVLPLVNHQFDTFIKTHADVLLAELMRKHHIRPALLRLYEYTTSSNVHVGSATSSRAALLLQLQRDILLAESATDELTRRYKKSLHFTYTNLPDPLPGSLEALLVFSCLNKTVQTGPDEVYTTKTESPTVMVFDNAKRSLQKREVPPPVLHFLRRIIRLDEMESIIPTLDLGADSLAELGYLPNLSPLSDENNSAENWQDKSLRKGILTEYLLWNGLGWFTMYLRTYENCCSLAGIKSGTTRAMSWAGSRADAARLRANGLASLLRQERQKKLIDRSQGAVTATRLLAPIHSGPYLVGQHSSGDI